MTARPAFADLPGVVWSGSGRHLHGDAHDATFTAQSAWYAPGRWTVTSASTLALPALTLYVARRGSAHGYWCNAPPMASYFGYCDAPALLPMFVGAKTCRAIASHDE